MSASSHLLRRSATGTVRQALPFMASSSSDPPGGADPRTLEYLDRLAERNRAMKTRQSVEEQRREQRLKSLEAGFDTCFSGANTDRVAKKAEQGRQRQNPLQLLHKQQQQRQSALQKPEPQQQQQQQQPPWRPGGNNDGGARRGWQQNTVVLAGQGGEQLKVRPKRSPALPATDAALGGDSELAQVAAAVRAAVAAAAAGPSTMSAEQREAAALDAAAERYEQNRSDDGGSGEDEDEEEAAAAVPQSHRTARVPTAARVPAPALPSALPSTHSEPGEYEDDFEPDEGGGSLRATLRRLRASMREAEREAESKLETARRAEQALLAERARTAAAAANAAAAAASAAASAAARTAAMRVPPSAAAVLDVEEVDEELEEAAAPAAAAAAAAAAVAADVDEVLDEIDEIDEIDETDDEAAGATAATSMYTPRGSTLARPSSTAALGDSSRLMSVTIRGSSSSGRLARGVVTPSARAPPAGMAVPPPPRAVAGSRPSSAARPGSAVPASALRPGVALPASAASPRVVMGTSSRVVLGCAAIGAAGGMGEGESAGESAAAAEGACLPRSGARAASASAVRRHLAAPFCFPQQPATPPVAPAAALAWASGPLPAVPSDASLPPRVPSPPPPPPPLPLEAASVPEAAPSTSSAAPQQLAAALQQCSGASASEAAAAAALAERLLRLAPHKIEMITQMLQAIEGTPTEAVGVTSLERGAAGTGGSSGSGGGGNGNGSKGNSSQSDDAGHQRSGDGADGSTAGGAGDSTVDSVAGSGGGRGGSRGGGRGGSVRLSRSAAQPNADEDDEDEDEQRGRKPRALRSQAALAVAKAGSPAVAKAGSPAVAKAGSPAVAKAGSPAVAKLPPPSRRQREPLVPKQTAPPTAPPSPPPIRRGSDIEDDFDDAFDDDAYDGGGPTRAAAPGTRHQAPGTSFSASSWAPSPRGAVGLMLPLNTAPAKPLWLQGSSEGVTSARGALGGFGAGVLMDSPPDSAGLESSFEGGTSGGFGNRFGNGGFGNCSAGSGGLGGVSGGMRSGAGVGGESRAPGRAVLTGEAPSRALTGEVLGMETESTAVTNLMNARGPGHGRRRPSVNELNASLSSLSTSLRLQPPRTRRPRVNSLNESLPAVPPAEVEGPETAPGTHALLTPRVATGPSSDPYGDELTEFMASSEAFNVGSGLGVIMGRGVGGGGGGGGGGGRPGAMVAAGDFEDDECLRPAVVAPPSRLPRGSTLRLSLLSTWGDPNYIGLSSLELLDEKAELVGIEAPKTAVRAHPSGVHELPGLTDDPRTADKLFVGQPGSTDAATMWLAPFTAGERHEVIITLPRLIRLHADCASDCLPHQVRGTRSSSRSRVRSCSRACVCGTITQAVRTHHAERAMLSSISIQP